MTEHVETRITADEVQGLAVACPKCGAEIVIDPARANRERFGQGARPMMCSACDEMLPSGVSRAIGLALHALAAAAEASVVYVVRRTR